MLGIAHAELKSKDLEEAQKEAVGKSVQAAKRKIDALNGFIKILNDEVDQ